MGSVEITYRYGMPAASVRSRPPDVESARLRLSEGNLTFADLLGDLAEDGGTASHIVEIDARDLAIAPVNEVRQVSFHLPLYWAVAASIRTSCVPSMEFYLLESDEIGTPTRSSTAASGLAEPPIDLASFIELNEEIVRSDRIASLITA